MWTRKASFTFVGGIALLLVGMMISNHQLMIFGLSLIAFITVKFVTEQVNVTRDRNDEVIEGDPNHVANVTDIWTFARNTRARDPNWTLVETRSQN